MPRLRNMEGKGGLGGEREDRTEWTHLLPPPTASPTPIPRTLSSSTFLSVANLPVLPSIDSLIFL